MKLTIMLLFILSSTFPTTIFAQQDSIVKKKLNQSRTGYITDAQKAGLTTGVQRLELLSDSAVMMENPTLIQPIGEPADSVSLDMHGLTEMLGASELAANEMLANAASANIVLKCNDPESLKLARTNGTLQLYSQACIIFELVNTITNLITEVDSLEKQNVEAQAAKNQAKAEAAKRDAEIEKEKKKMQETNKLIKKAIADLKKAKEAQEKATKEVEKATQALAAASAIQCGEDDDGSCASAKASAVAAATKALDEAKKALEKANKALEKATAKMINLLVNKLGIETSAVLAMLNGTIRASTDGGDVNFQVGESDFTLVNLGKVISGVIGSGNGNPGNYVNGDGMEKETKDYFESVIGNFQKSEDNDNDDKPVNHYLGVTGPQGEDALREVLQGLTALEGGLENLETIALAVQDYSEQKGEKQIKLAEAMKTAGGRADEIEKQIENRNAMIANIKKMLAQNMDFLEKSLVAFKGIFELTQVSAPQGQAVVAGTPVANQNGSNNPFYVYINKFTKDLLAKKITEGYKSEVKYLVIQATFKCYAEGGDGESCKKVEDGSAPTPSKPKLCQWIAIVAGPVTPPAPSCAVEGEKTNHTNYEWTCRCGN